MKKLMALLMVNIALIGGNFASVYGQNTQQTAIKPKKKSQQPSTDSTLSFGNSKEPIQIDANSLEVRDKEKLAIFTGNVVAVQGAGQLTTNMMKVFYEDNKQTTGTQSFNLTANEVPNSNNRKIKRIEATGNVRVVQNGQIGTGDSGIYDMQNGLITLLGNVSLTQNGNVVQGDTLVVNTKTQESIVTSNNRTGKRVRALIENSDEKPKQ